MLLIEQNWVIFFVILFFFTFKSILPHLMCFFIFVTIISFVFSHRHFILLIYFLFVVVTVVDVVVENVLTFLCDINKQHQKKERGRKKERKERIATNTNLLEF